MRRSLGIGLILGAIALALILNRPGQDIPGFAGSFDLKPLGTEGLSALWISPDGLRYIAISDRSLAVAGDIRRGVDGQITAVTAPYRGDLLGPNGTIDSEGLAIGPEEVVFVSTEGGARVLRFEALDLPGEPVGRPRDFGKWPTNGALEALAIAPDGTLFTMPETADPASGLFPVFAGKDGTWAIVAQLAFPRGYRPVSADIGPDGRLYILLRGFIPVLGFAMQLQRHDLSGTEIGPAQPLIATSHGQFGNAEGLSVWRAPLGGLMATMVTDDNGNWFQNAALIEVHLPD